jgi:hypothetical protein
MEIAFYLFLFFILVKKKSFSLMGIFSLPPMPHLLIHGYVCGLKKDIHADRLKFITFLIIIFYYL